MGRSEIQTVWWGWLLAACAITMLFSLSFVLLPEATLASMSDVYLGSPDAHEAFGEVGVSYLRFVLGVSGAVSVAWMGALLIIVLGPFRQGESWAWLVIAASIVLWFAVDSAHSIASGFPQNALNNLVFLIGFGIPLAATYRRFQNQ
jgi:hypothetical protein